MSTGKNKPKAWAMASVIRTCKKKMILCTHNLSHYNKKIQIIEKEQFQLFYNRKKQRDFRNKASMNDNNHLTKM